jgi:DNA repair protein RadC
MEHQAYPDFIGQFEARKRGKGRRNRGMGDAAGDTEAPAGPASHPLASPPPGGRSRTSPAPPQGRRQGSRALPQDPPANPAAQTDKDNRPRERLLRGGPASLSDHELLAILLNTGIRGKNVSALAKELLELLNRRKGIPPIQDLVALDGLGQSKACAVAAMLEFGRRRWGAAGARIRQPQEIYELLKHHADRKQERFLCLSLNGAHEVLALRIVSIGLVNRTIVHPREVFADPIMDRAAAVIVAHNHPSGQLRPSPEDDEITARLKAAAAILGLNFLDHLIFTDTAWFSYRQSGRMEELAQQFPV